MSQARLCKSSDVPANGMKAFDLADGRKVLVANANDSYYAYQAICPHQEVCLDEGFFDGAVLTCHQHLWQWDITTGAAVGLAEAPLERYDIKVEDGELFVVESSALHAAEIFTGIAGSTLVTLDRLARREARTIGDTLYRIGDPADDLYILDAGRVEFRIGRDERTSAAGFMLRRGEVFGWNALVENQPNRIAQATCLENSTVLRLNGRDTLQVFETDPASGYQVMRKLATLITRYLTASGAK